MGSMRGVGTPDPGWVGLSPTPPPRGPPKGSQIPSHVVLQDLDGVSLVCTRASPQERIPCAHFFSILVLNFNLTPKSRPFSDLDT